MSNQSRAPLRVTFFGDSICVGQGVSIYRGWVTRVAGRLEQLAEETGSDIVVTNSSVNGSTTRQALERMPYDVQSHGVDILIVQFGMNDCNYWQSDHGLPRVSPESFAANLKEIVQRGIRFGAKRIFLHNNHPTTRHKPDMAYADRSYEASNRHYNGIVRRVSQSLPSAVEFIDIEAGFDAITGGQAPKLAGLLLADGLHLSTAGHDVYFDLVSEKIADSVASALSHAD